MPPTYPTARSTLRLSRPSCSADHSFSLCRGRHPFPQETESGGREERAPENAVKDLGMGKAEGSWAPPYPITQPLFSRVLPTTVSDFSLINGGDQIGGGGSSSQRTDSTWWLALRLVFVCVSTHPPSPLTCPHMSTKSCEMETQLSSAALPPPTSRSPRPLALWRCPR